MQRLLSTSLAALAISAASLPAHADDTQAAINAMEAYLEFVDYRLEAALNFHMPIKSTRSI